MIKFQTLAIFNMFYFKHMKPSLVLFQSRENYMKTILGTYFFMVLFSNAEKLL